MTDDVKLDIYGTTHVLSADSLTDEFRSFASRSDGFCVEECHAPPPGRFRLRSFVRNPTVWIALWVYGLLTVVVKLATGGDAAPLERALAERADPTDGGRVHPVDCDVFRLAAGVSRPEAALSWTVAAFVAFFVLEAAVGLVGLDLSRAAFAGTVVLSAPVITSLPFLARIDDRRNRTMLANARRVSDERGYDRVCLVVGDAHRAELERLAPAFGFDVTSSASAR